MNPSILSGRFRIFLGKVNRCPRSIHTHTRTSLRKGTLSCFTLTRVFIYAALSREPVGNRARQLLQRVSDGDEEAGSCTLTFDELAWVVQKHRSREDALAAGQSFLVLRNLNVFSVGQDSLFAALSVMQRYALPTRCHSRFLCCAEQVLGDSFGRRSLRSAEGNPQKTDLDILQESLEA
jgi:hypothetical protein